MGFYGNIRNTTSNSFKFDRVYSNRTIMEENANIDGVFGGRYVLVEYDQPLDENPGSVTTIYRPDIHDASRYYNGVSLAQGYAEYDEQSGILSNEVLYIKFIEQSDYADPKDEFWTDEEPSRVIHTSIPAITYKDKQNIDEFNDYDYTTVTSKIPATQIWIKPDESDSPEAIDVTCYVFVNDIINNEVSITSGFSEWRIYDKLGTLRKFNGNEEDAYTINYTIDKTVYGLGRGYDSTVWRKTYSNDGQAKYIMLAELNSVVPTFALSPDGPSDLPQKPHFDRDSTNVYYNLHLQTPWAFRIASFEDNENPNRISAIKKKVTFDENVNMDDFQIVDALDIAYDSSGHYIDEYRSTPHPYAGAVYFNTAGFDKEKSNHTYALYNDKEYGITIENYNGIRIDNYKSGALYNNRTNPEEYEKEEYDDTKELSIILPIIGNTVADMWDMMYGDGKIVDGEKTNKRQLDIKWDDPNHVSDLAKERLHLIHDDGIKPVEAQTLAGAINSVHDIMGMIITEDVMPEDANDAHTWQIYYDKTNNAYYYAAESVDVVPIRYNNTTSRFTSDDNKINVVVKTAAEFENQFANNNNVNSYDPITGLKDLPTFIANNRTNPLFTNIDTDISNQGNVYRVVSDTVATATPNALYYQLPTQLTAVSALMNAGDTEHEWYYEFTEQRTPQGSSEPITISGYKLLPDYGPEDPEDPEYGNDKQHALEKETRYYWIDWRCAAAHHNDAKKAYVLDRGALFKTDNSTNTYINISNSTWQKYQDGEIYSFAQLLEEEGIVNGQKGNTTYDITSIYYLDPEPYQEPEYDEEGNIIGWIIGHKYLSRLANELIFPNENDGINSYYYRLNNISPKRYEKMRWPQILTNYNLAGEVEYKFEPTNIQELRRESECYYIVFKDTDEAQAKKEELTAFVAANPDANIDNFNAYFPYIYEFNRSTNLDGFSDEYNYFLCAAPHPVGYGIGSKPNPNEVTYSSNRFFTDGTLYFKDSNNIFRIAGKTSDYVFRQGDTLYRKLNQFCIYSATDLFEGQFNPFEDLNTEIIRSDKDVPNGVNTDIVNYFASTDVDGNATNDVVTLGYRVKSRTWKQLYGFARDINTLHGWLLKLNDVLQANDYKTRDRSTVQGCINTLNDIFEKFNDLIPGELYGVNKYGRIDAVTLNGESGSGKWIDVTTDVNEDTGKTTLNVSHFTNSFADDSIYTLTSDTTLGSNKQYYISTGDNTYKLYTGSKWISGLYEKTTKSTSASKHQVFGFNYGTDEDSHLSNDYNAHAINDVIKHNSSTFTRDTIEIISPTLDNAGHVIGEKKTNFDLPLNYNKISTVGKTTSENAANGSTTAANIQPSYCADTLKLAVGNKWLEINVSSSNSDNSDTLTVAHLLSGVTSNSTVTTVQPNNLAASDYSTTAGTQSFSIPYFTVDKAGHMTSLENRHINLLNLHLGGNASISNTDELKINGTQTLQTVLTNLAASINADNYTAPTETSSTIHSYDTTPIATGDGVNEALAKLQSQINDIKYNNNYTTNGSKEHFSFIYRQIDEPTGAYTGYLWVKGNNNPQPGEVREIYIFNGVQWELLNAWQ